MNVAELIAELEKVEDKSLPVILEGADFTEYARPEDFHVSKVVYSYGYHSKKLEESGPSFFRICCP